MLYYLQGLADWKTLGAYILPKDSVAQLDSIDRTYKGNVQQCKQELFTEYLKSGDRSWSTIIAALIKMREINLVDEIKEKLGL